MFKLPELLYSYDSLEPFIDAKTMEIHHSKHHQTYVTNLNNALAQIPELETKTIEELIGNLNSVPESIRTAVRNNGGGHLNHSLFWNFLTPSKLTETNTPLQLKIQEKWNSLDLFKEDFTKSALGRFGSGWVWLTTDLEILSTPNQDSPLIEGKKVVLGLDVWEHAYYLKYQNKRADYVSAFWNLVNWEYCNNLYNSK
jgi:Fe-Mn family superoxide dismutase